MTITTSRRNFVAGASLTMLAGPVLAKPRTNPVRVIADRAYALWIKRNASLAFAADPLSAVVFDDAAETVREQAATASRLTQAAGQINRKTLSARNLALLDQTVRVLNEIEESRINWLYSFTLDSYTSPLFGAQTFYEGFDLSTPALRAKYATIVQGVAKQADVQLAKLAMQTAQGIYAPVPLIENAVEVWTKLVETSPEPGKHFLIPQPERLGKIGVSGARVYTAQLAAIVRNAVNPAARRLIAALGPAYRARAPKDPGLHQYPGGLDAYRRMVAGQLSVGIDLQDLHRIGLARVAEYDAEIITVARRLGYEGEITGFDAWLLARPGATAMNPGDWTRLFDAALDRIRDKLPQAFARIPITPAYARRMPESLEGTMTYGWFDVATKARPEGIYYFNGTPGRALSGASDLIYHELLPGHHMQYEVAKLAMLHPIQSDYYSSFYGEGWAEYSTIVARELGCFTDDVQLYGHLVAKRFMAARIVLDTGMNALGWSLEKARSYMRTYTAVSDDEISSELIRYGARMPGQALGYHFGMLKLIEERERARVALGPRFDVRDYHSAVLEAGDIGFATIRARVDALIAAKSR